MIDTAANSRVVILVAHNNARWDLGPNKHGKVGESLAWTAAKQDRPAAAVIEESSTAGAHAEKSAATTGTTTEAPRAAMTEPAADQPPASQAVATPSTDDLRVKGSAPGGAATPSPLPPPPPPPRPSRNEGSRRKDMAPSPPTVATSAPRDKEMANDAVPIEEKKSETSKAQLSVSGGAADDKMGASDGGAGGGDPVRQLQQGIRDQFAKGRTEMRACFDPSVANVLITITVTKGVYAITTVDPAATPKARACLASIAKGMGTTTKHDKPVYVKLTLAKP